VGKKLYIGNLPFSVSDQTLSAHFAALGEVTSARVIKDKESGRSRGFGFVEYSSEEEAASAISQLNGTDFDGREITVNEAREMAPRENRGGYGKRY